MSISAVTEGILAQVNTQAEKSVLLILCARANDSNGRIAWSSVERLMYETCAGRRTVQRALHALEQQGHIVGFHEGRHRKYRVRPKMRPEFQRKNGRQNGAGRSEAGANLAPNGRHFDAPPAPNSTAKGAILAPQSSLNRNLTGSESSERLKTARERDPKDDAIADENKAKIRAMLGRAIKRVPA